MHYLSVTSVITSQLSPIYKYTTPPILAVVLYFQWNINDRFLFVSSVTHRFNPWTQFHYNSCRYIIIYMCIMYKYVLFMQLKWFTQSIALNKIQNLSFHQITIGRYTSFLVTFVCSYHVTWNIICSINNSTVFLYVLLRVYSPNKTNSDCRRCFVYLPIPCYLYI